MLKDTILLLALALLLNGCYSNKFVTVSGDSQTSLKTINRNVRNETAQIYLVSGESFKGKSVHVTKDSTFWLDAETESTRHGVATSDIRSISTEHRNAGKGFGYGLLIGAATGAILGALAGEDCDDVEDGPCFPRDGLALIGGIAFGSVSSLIGLASGFATKTTENYEFE